ncbi:MAG: DUF4395 family protein [Betaproteobacteria bacterium]|nr:DUF4395 family protein [Betaproteobacteria bacterium]
MLRFDIPPVWSNVIRFEAFLTFVMCLLAYTLSPWLMVIPAVQGFIRGFFGHHREPMHGVWVKLFESRGWAGKKENAGAKMFAAKLLCIASSAAVGLYLGGQSFWVVPVYVLLVFSTLEWAFSFCAGCWAYTLWFQAFPPKG